MADSSSKKPTSYSNLWPWFFLAAAFESLIAALWLLLIPSEGGLSPARLAVLSIIIALLAAGMFGWHLTRRKLHGMQALVNARNITISSLLFLTFGLFLFLLRYFDPERSLPYYERIGPLFWLLFFLAAQTAAFFLFLKNGFNPRVFSGLKQALLPFGALLVIFAFVSISKIGLKADTAYWGEPGVPMQMWQFVLAIAFGFIVSQRAKTKRFADVILPVLIYAAAIALWLGVPVKVLQNSFYSPITPPAYQPFPYSDAGFYDSLAQSLLIGADYFGSIPPRPLYVTFLAFLHLLAGQNYHVIIAGQTLVLALFPVFLYFLGKRIHSPAAGVIAALFAIFRELVALWVSSNIRVSNSKMLTTDFPTALGIALLCFVIIWWLQRRDFTSTIIAGCMFGLLLLFRTQSLLVLPFVFLLAWFAYQKKAREWMISGFVFGFAMALVVLPWLLHNRSITGKLTFDDPRQMAVIYSQYSFEGNLDLSQFDPETDRVGERIISFTLENPAFVANFIAAHMINTEISGLLSLPLIERYDGLFAPVNLYWPAWNGQLEAYNVLLVILYLAFISLGLGRAWHTLGWTGLVPLAFNLGYALSNGISRFSGWRYNLPVDWIIYFYAALGIAEALRLAALSFNSSQKIENESNPLQFQSVISFSNVRLYHAAFTAAFITIGAMPWLAKGLVHYRYTSNREDLKTLLISAGYEENALDQFLAQPDAVIYEGRMLYPRLYRKNEGISSANPWAAYQIRDFARIGFLLINDKSRSVIFRTRDLLDFHHGADVVLLGCRMDEYIEARIVVFDGSVFQSASLIEPCP